MRKALLTLAFLLLSTSLASAQFLPEDLVGAFSNQVGLEFAGFSPPGSIDFYGEATSAVFAGPDQVPMGTAVKVTVRDPNRVTRLVGEPNFECVEKEVVLVEFTAEDQVTMSFARPPKTVLLVFDADSGRWRLKG